MGAASVHIYFIVIWRPSPYGLMPFCEAPWFVPIWIFLFVQVYQKERCQPAAQWYSGPPSSCPHRSCAHFVRSFWRQSRAHRTPSSVPLIPPRKHDSSNSWHEKDWTSAKFPRAISGKRRLLLFSRASRRACKCLDQQHHQKSASKKWSLVFIFWAVGQQAMSRPPLLIFWVLIITKKLTL